MSDEKVRLSGESDRSRMEKDEMVLPTVNPTVAAQQEKKKLHPAFYIAAWIGLSGSVILYNKWVLARKQFSMFKQIHPGLTLVLTSSQHFVRIHNPVACLPCSNCA